jgi:hypothetical protein
MNLRKACFVATAVVGLTVALSAQRATTADKGASKVQAQSVTLTGCMVQGVDADHYRLANAVRREQPPASTGRAGASASVRSDKAGADDRTGPYDLQGSEFKAHLGHKVEITGTDGTTAKASDPAARQAPQTEGAARVQRAVRQDAIDHLFVTPDCG